MRGFKSPFAFAKAALPILYCGGLLYYFLDVGGTVQDIRDNGLGPAVIGFGAVNLLFCLPLVMKLVRLLRGLTAPGPAGAPKERDDEAVDDAAADAVIARYMARKSAEAAANTPMAGAPFANPPAPRATGGPAKRPGFGRRV